MNLPPTDLPVVRIPTCILLFSIVMVLLYGCRGSGEVSREHEAVADLVSTDGVLRYRLLSGWFSANSDSTNGGHAVWLVRNDYAVSLVVERVHLDAAARSQVREKGLARIAELLAPLVAGDRVASLREGPQAVRVGETVVWSSEFETTPRAETLRVTLLNVDGKVYAVRVLTSAAAGVAVRRDDLLKDERTFLESLRW